jgi:hypothetical protein
MSSAAWHAFTLGSGCLSLESFPLLPVPHRMSRWPVFIVERQGISM